MIAGSAEEIFFRGYMQSRLREHWSPGRRDGGDQHGVRDPARRHLGSCTSCWPSCSGCTWATSSRLTGSALPAITCHIANNVLYTLQTALGMTLPGRRANLIAAPIAAAVFVGCVLWLRRAARCAPPLPPA